MSTMPSLPGVRTLTMQNDLMNIILVCRDVLNKRWEEIVPIANHLLAHDHETVGVRALSTEDIVNHYSRSVWRALPIHTEAYVTAIKRIPPAECLVPSISANAAVAVSEIMPTGVDSDSTQDAPIRRSERVQKKHTATSDSGAGSCTSAGAQRPGERAGQTDIAQQTGACSSTNDPPMLMVHGGHFALSYEDGETIVTSPIPTDASAVDGLDVFAPPDSRIYFKGGKVLRATFRWTEESNRIGSSAEGRMNGSPGLQSWGEDDRSETRDVMLCRKQFCNACDSSIRMIWNSSGSTARTRPFVHSCCLEQEYIPGQPIANWFKPVGELRLDWLRPHPNTEIKMVTFQDGIVRQALVCIPRTCEFCLDILRQVRR